MKKEDAEQFAAMVNGTMVEIYARGVLSRDGMRMWWAALSMYGLSEIRAALSAHVTDPDEGQHPPKPSSLLKRLSGTGDGRAYAAWAKVLLAAKRVGTYRSVVFDDQLIHSAIADMGGWTAIGKITEDELPFKQAEFIRRYRALLISAPADYPKSLSGITALENSREGVDTEGPVLIGDPEKAAEVYAAGGSGALQITYTKSPALIGKSVGALLLKGN